MSEFVQKGERTRYAFLDERCIGRTCFAPGLFQHRAPLAGGGSMNTSSPPTACCMNRAYRGCPAGPDGERREACHVCEGHGTLIKVREAGAGPSDYLTEYEPCYVCAVAGTITIQGCLEYSETLAEQRKVDGWRRKR